MNKSLSENLHKAKNNKWNDVYIDIPNNIIGSVNPVNITNNNNGPVQISNNIDGIIQQQLLLQQL